MIGVIADDLSGAAELGAIGRRRGLRAEIVFDGPIDSRADLVCLDTDSRSCNAEEADARARRAARTLAAAGAKWIYKKVDSVLRGNVMVEINALMSERGLPLALLAPANPSLRRTIRQGQYFVRGKLLHETEFARDPHYPRTSPNVRKLLEAPGMEPVQLRRLGEPLPAAGIVVGEAGSSDDVQAWAALVDGQIQPAGAAEFFGALLAREKIASPVAAAPDKGAVNHRELFVCGSTSESSREFIRNAQKMGVPVFALPDSLAAGGEFDVAAIEAISLLAAGAFQQHSRVILSIGLPLAQNAQIARRLSGHLVNVAANVLESVRVGHVYAEGGETAAALVRRMRWGSLTVLRELAPGVATVVPGNDESLQFTLKPGTYAWPALPLPHSPR